MCVCVIQALDWCIESATLLSGTDMLGATQQQLLNGGSNNTNSHKIKQELEHFLASYPPPTEEDVTELHQLTENMEDNQWIKNNATFAYHRVLEVKERFSYYTRLLEQHLQHEARQQAAAGQAEHQMEEDNSAVVRVGSVVRVQLVGDVEEEDGGVGCNIKTWDSEEDLLRAHKGVTLRHPHKNLVGQSSSLHYDDTGVDHAMMLLKSVAQSADAKLMPPPTHGEEGGVKGRGGDVKGEESLAYFVSCSCT